MTIDKEGLASFHISPEQVLQYRYKTTTVTFKVPLEKLDPSVPAGKFKYITCNRSDIEVMDHAWSEANDLSGVTSRSSGRELTKAEATMKGLEDLTIKHYADKGLDATKNRGISPNNKFRETMHTMAEVL